MVLSENEQIALTLKNSSHILITFKKDFTVDALATALALYLILKKMDKLVDLIASDFKIGEGLNFLPETQVVQSDLNNLQKFVITVDLKDKKIDNLSYNLEEDQLKIFLTPRQGSLESQDVKSESSDYKYDLIVTLDTPDLASLGSTFNRFTDFFYNTTIINIDTTADNEHFGQINLVNLNAVASAEILFNLINSLDEKLLDADIATCLLTGLISKTKSFKTANVTPKTLEIAGILMQAGAQKDLIIKNLYRNRSLATLNLWGRVLARLKSDSQNQLVWSVITEQDFLEAQGKPEDLPEVIEELISFLPAVQIVVLLYQKQGQNCVLIRTFKNHNALYLAGTFSPTGNKSQVEFCLNDLSLADAEKTVIDQIKDKLPQE